MTGRKPQQAGDKKVVTLLLYRAYGMLKMESFLAPGSAQKRLKHLAFQGYTVQIKMVELELTV